MNIIIKYENRKLYDKQNARYISTKKLIRLQLGSFKVIDHVTKNDVTIDVLRAALVGEAPESEKKTVTKYLASLD